MKSLLLLPFHHNTIHSLPPSPTSSSLHITTRQHRLTNYRSQLRFLPNQFPTLPRESINSLRTHCRINDFISLCINNGQGETNLTPASTCSWWWKYFYFSTKWFSGIVALYLFGLTLIGDSNGFENVSSVFSCEDVEHYYSSVDHKEAEELMRELNSIVSPHVSLPYKKVWEALKILDAADDDNPEASSDVTSLGIVALYLFGLTLIGDSNGFENVSSVFSCEDVEHYYSSVDHKEGEELMRELNSIVSPHVSLPYKKVWEALKILDAADDDNPEASSDVVEIYSLRGVSKLLAGKPEGWNREHLWPRSYGLTDGPSLTDLHNIRPADVNVNSSRGNKYYGECLAISTHCLKPANKEAAYDTETDKKLWAPPLQVRGDIARSLMYMATTYGFSQSDGSQNLRLSDSPSAENSEMGLLSTLLKWNEVDPPSRTEKLRNNRFIELVVESLADASRLKIALYNGANIENVQVRVISR